MAADPTSAQQSAKTSKASSASNVSMTLAAKRAERRRARRAGDKKRTAKLQSDKEFAKGFFEGRSKRSADKKQAYRKKKSRKK
jgi:hypothetical protein